VPAVTQLNFDPTTSVLGLSIRWETLALAGVVLLVLVLAAVSSGRDRGGAVRGVDGVVAPKLRRDDLILIGFGAVPGAVVGGRLSYALIHLDYYWANPGALTDPGQGGFGLTLAVVVGALTAIAVARLLAAPINRWLSVAALPVLLGLGLGKFTMVLGGAGQGRYTGSSLATAYAGDGPWGSLNPTFAAFPSQIAEGILVLAVAVLVLLVPPMLRFRVTVSRHEIDLHLAPRRDWLLLTGGRRFMTVFALWAAARFVAEFTWRDAHVLGPFVADQLVLALVIALGFVGPELLGGSRRLRRAVAARLAARLAARRAARAKRVELAELASRGVGADAPPPETTTVAEGFWPDEAADRPDDPSPAVPADSESNG
jgi:prolipoprotein diacylglyceryltransferase